MSRYWGQAEWGVSIDSIEEKYIRLSKYNYRQDNWLYFMWSCMNPVQSPDNAGPLLEQGNSKN